MIKPNQEYTLKDMRDGKMIPWALHYQTLRRIIAEDMIGKNILQVIKQREGRQARYTIKGSRIIKYKQNYCK